MQNCKENQSTQAFTLFNLLSHLTPELLVLMLFVPTYFSQEAYAFLYSSRCRAYNVFFAPNSALSSTLSPPAFYLTTHLFKKCMLQWTSEKTISLVVTLLEMIKLITKLYMSLAFYSCHHAVQNNSFVKVPRLCFRIYLFIHFYLIFFLLALIMDVTFICFFSPNSVVLTILDNETMRRIIKFMLRWSILVFSLYNTASRCGITNGQKYQSYDGDKNVMILIHHHVLRWS